MEVQQESNTKVGFKNRIKVVFTNINTFLGPDINEEDDVEYKKQKDYIELDSEAKKELDEATKLVTSSEFNAAVIAKRDKKKQTQSINNPKVNNKQILPQVIMQKMKNEKGVTIIVLVITIIVLLLISVPIVIRTTDISKTKKYNEFIEDIVRLNESISQLYDLNSDLSQIGPVYNGDTTFLSQKNVNDNNIYYIIDCDKLNSDLQNRFNMELQKLNYGTNNYNIDENDLKTNDVYIINAQSRTVYYPDGIAHNGSILYRTSEQYTEISVREDQTPPTTNILHIENSTDHLFAIKAEVVIGDEFSFLDYSKCKYQFTTTNTALGTDESLYTDGTVTNTGIIEKVKGAGTYYLHVLATDIKGNSSETISTNSVTIEAAVDYNYTGNVQIASLLPGNYKLEVWGAQGGGSIQNGSLYSNLGGKGGYSVGILTLNNDSNTYINVGQMGSVTLSANTAGGWNGRWLRNLGLFY